MLSTPPATRSDAPAPAHAPQGARLAWPTLLALALGVVTLHLLLWFGMADSFAAAAAPTRMAPAVQVRTVQTAMPIPAPEAATAPARPTPKPAPRRPSPSPLASPEKSTAAAIAEPAPQAGAEAAAEPVVLVAAALPAPGQAVLTPVAAKGGADEVPVYRTQMPPAITLRYDMRRGSWSGTGELQWRPTAGGYEARLEGRLAGFRLLTWASQGGFDAAGLAPVRYTDERRGKDMQAANFQRQAGKITYSGPSTEYPLLQGTQDRLSWMIQIAAIAQADPKRLAPGGRISMFVSGARGDADVWAFRVEGNEEVSTGDTAVPAIKLLREPRKPHDTRVEVWLAPSLHHLPVQARLSNEGPPLELRMLSHQAAP